MKKTLFDVAMNEVFEMVNKISEYDEIAALSMICMMIDTVARDSDKTAPEIAELISEKVKEVYEELGAY